ncbi:hypothetical protein DQ067_25260, partial [Salmonella enterica subsp. enterica serovar Malaysia]|nr:hypothetical protein [Salmonella enterica subsp. enterica serovar Guinea]
PRRNIFFKTCRSMRKIKDFLYHKNIKKHVSSINSITLDHAIISDDSKLTQKMINTTRPNSDNILTNAIDLILTID